MKRILSVACCVVFAMSLAVVYDADGGRLFNRSSDRCTDNRCKPNMEEFPTDEIEQYNIDNLEVAPIQTERAPVDSLADRVSALEALIGASGFSVVFEAGDESDEVERAVYVEPGGVLRIPAQMLRIRTVDSSGRNVGEPIVDVAPLGSPLKVRNKLR